MSQATWPAARDVSPTATELDEMSPFVGFFSSWSWPFAGSVLGQRGVRREFASQLDPDDISGMFLRESGELPCTQLGSLVTFCPSAHKLSTGPIDQCRQSVS